MTNFQIRALKASQFSALFHLEAGELEKLCAMKMTVDKKPGFPCRVSLEDAEIGEEVILLNYHHHQTTSPYQSGGPIFIRKDAATARPELNQIPAMLTHKLLSLRGYDNAGMMASAAVCDGRDIRDYLCHMFENSKIESIHIHSAKEGCFNCKADRV